MRITKPERAGQPAAMISFILLFLLSSMVSSPPEDLNPVGIYEFTTSDDGKTFTADLVIEGTPGSYHGTVRRKDADITIQFTDVGLSGEKLIIVADVRNSVFVLRLYFTGDAFTGNWSMGDEGNELTGKRVK